MLSHKEAFNGYVIFVIFVTHWLFSPLHCQGYHSAQMKYVKYPIDWRGNKTIPSYFGRGLLTLIVG